MRNRRITKTYFRTCSRCLSRSQAPLCLYTLRLVSNQPEGTIARLRYSLGGDRPSQTTHHRGSLDQFHGRRLDIRNEQGGISLDGSTQAGAHASKPPTYSTQFIPHTTLKLQ